MKLPGSFLHRLARDRDGATIVEFAFVVTPLFMVLLGLTDFGYRIYVDSVVQGTVYRAARLATVGDKTADQIDDFVKAQLMTFSGNGVVTIDKKNYYQFSNVDNTEKWIDKNNDGVFNHGDCWIDSNPDNPTDGPGPTARDGLGGSDDIVFYKVTLTYPRIIPLGGFFGWSDTQTISAKTLMRNQPYASQATPPCRDAP